MKRHYHGASHEMPPTRRHSSRQSSSWYEDDDRSQPDDSIHSMLERGEGDLIQLGTTYTKELSLYDSRDNQTFRDTRDNDRQVQMSSHHRNSHRHSRPKPKPSTRAKTDGWSDYFNATAGVSKETSRKITTLRQYLPLIEKSRGRTSRPIYAKWKPLTRFVNKGGIHGVVKSLASTSSALGHWAIEVGDYTHELTVENGVIGHFRGYWIEPPLVFDGDTTPRKVGARMQCGETSLTDVEINEQAQRIILQMKITGGDYDLSSPTRWRNQKDYDTVFNNCQRFCRKMAFAISQHSHLARARCMAFFVTNSISPDVLCLCLAGAVGVGSTLIVSALIMQATPTESGSTPDGLGNLIAPLIAIPLRPLTRRLEREYNYIAMHGRSAYDIFDRKSSLRQTAEKLLVDLSTSLTVSKEELEKRRASNTDVKRLRS